VPRPHVGTQQTYYLFRECKDPLPCNNYQSNGDPTRYDWRDWNTARLALLLPILAPQPAETGEEMKASEKIDHSGPVNLLFSILHQSNLNYV
jgi:hypothetical protein